MTIETLTIAGAFDDDYARPPRFVQPIVEAELEQATTDLFTVHTRACEVCGASFQTCGKGRRCSGCLVQSAAPLQPARITCRVCGAQASVALDWPALLCQGCIGDLEGTRERVSTWLAAALAALDANQATWQAYLALSPAADKWPAIQGALIAVAEKRATQAQLAATWAKRKAEGGPLALLLAAHEAYTRECDRLELELQRLDRAQAEINQAFLVREL